MHTQSSRTLVGPLLSLCRQQATLVLPRTRSSRTQYDQVRKFTTQPRRRAIAAAKSATTIKPAAAARPTGNGSATTAAKSAATLTPRSAAATTATSRPAPTPAFASNSVDRSRTGSSQPIADLSNGLNDSFSEEEYNGSLETSPLPTTENTDSDASFLQPSLTSGAPIDWTRSFHGLSTTPFAKEAADVLLQEIPAADIEVKPDGIVYLPEIKYRRILNRAFGPGGWGLAPRGEALVTTRTVTREFGLVVNGRLVSVARGEQQYFDPEGIPTATEGCKSNALMRCCKDLGVASELWDPVFLRNYKKDWTRDVWVEHVTTKKKRRITVKKGVAIGYPYKEASGP